MINKRSIVFNKKFTKLKTHRIKIVNYILYFIKHSLNFYIKNEFYEFYFKVSSDSK